jgi:DNA-binding LacI/PurR family transcriptional regulator/signal transduction histidine kinase
MEKRPVEQLRIGVLTPRISCAYFSDVICGVVAATDAAGARTVVIQTSDLRGPHGDFEGYVPGPRRRVGWDRVTGVVVLPHGADAAAFRALAGAGKPVVSVSESAGGLAVPNVVPDNRSGVAAAVAHLVQHGHQRIAFAGPKLQTDMRERYDAYREALVAHGIQPSERLFFESDDNVETGGYRVGHAMIEAGMPSTAVIAGNDWNALGIMKVLREAGCSLPRDQAIIGFDDVEEAASVRPSLSTVRYSFQEGGRVAATLLLRMIEGGAVDAVEHRVPTRFVVRESCGCTAGSALAALSDSEPVLPATPEVRFRFRLERLLGVDAAITEEQSAALTEAIEILRECARTDPDAPSAGFDRAAQALLSITSLPTALTMLIACLRAYFSETAAGRASDLAAALQVEKRVAEMTSQLSRTQAGREANERTAANVWRIQDSLVGIELMGAAGSDGLSLDWLAHTPALSGCLGLWTPHTETEDGNDVPLLDVTAWYRRGAAPPPVAEPARLSVESFPPEALVEDEAWPRGVIAAVLPVKTLNRDIGLLAMVVPATPEHLTGRDWTLDYANLFSSAAERVLATARLRRSEAELATLSREMAHNLRNPLASIAMFTASAEARVAVDRQSPALPVMLNRIGEVTRYASDLVNDLLRYADLDRPTARRQSVDLNEAVQRAETALEAEVTESGAEVDAVGLPIVLGRSSELQLVFQNLIENAIAHRGSAPPRVHLSASRPAAGWMILCVDNGAGIPAELRNHVFEPFVRAEEGSGGGMGLAICRRIVEGHGGKIWIAETGATGTTIALTLPEAAGRRSDPEPG